MLALHSYMLAFGFSMGCLSSCMHFCGDAESLHLYLLFYLPMQRQAVSEKRPSDNNICFGM